MGGNKPGRPGSRLPPSTGHSRPRFGLDLGTNCELSTNEVRCASPLPVTEDVQPGDLSLQLPIRRRSSSNQL